MNLRRVFHSSLPSALAAALVMVTLPAVVAGAVSQPASAAASDPGAITLRVESARTVDPADGFVHQGDAIEKYKWLVNVDDTGDPGTAANPGTERCLPATAAGGSSDPDFADTCPWPSIRNTSGFAPIVAQGDQTELNGTDALQGLPPGKYLISVTAADFKIDGAHFTVRPGETTHVTVGMNPTPLPLTTLRIQVYQDNVPVDSTYEADAESGLQGFTAHLTDVFGDVSVDYYGNALCTVYRHENNDPAAPVVFDADDHPVVDTTRSTGRCVSDSTGLITIPNLGPNRYAATVAPPAGQADQWVQTTTLEGAKDWDIWSQEGETGFDNEVLKGGEPVPMVQFGFVRPRAITVPRTNPPTGEVKGVVVAGLPYIGGAPGLSYETGFPNTLNGGPIKRPWVALSDLDAGDAAIYVGRGAVDGSFDIKNVPDGTYQLSLWDDDIDYILWSFNVEVRNGGLTNVGNKAITGWFTHVHGHVFIDDNGNGQRDPGESGVAGFPLSIRERDNSLMDQYTNTAVTDDSGTYDIRETYPLGKWLVLEAFDTRYQTTGISYRGENEKSWTTKLGGLVDLDFLPIIGLGGEVDWGVQPYATGTNGGIAGTVSYDTTRNELDPADAASESYQPGIPDLPVHLYASVPCTATTALGKANTCRQGKEIVPLQLADPSAARLRLDAQSTLVESGTADGVAQAGESVDHTWTATNDGTVALHGLAVAATPDLTVTCTTTDLAPGDHTTCTGSHTVTAADVTAGLVRAEATATAADPDGTTVTSPRADDEQPASAGLVALAAGSLADTDGDQRADTGERVTYTFTVTNHGTETLTDVAVTDTLPGLAPSCPAGPLAPGEHVDCTSSYVVGLEDTLKPALADSATATATRPDATTATSPESTDTLPTDRMVLNPAGQRGAFVKGPELTDPYVTETWQPPRGCTAYDYKGNPLLDQRALPAFGPEENRMCVEAPMMGVAIGPSDDSPGAAGQTVNGNYGFGSSDLNLYPPGNVNNPAPDHDLPLYADLAAAGYEPQDLRAGDYLVEVGIPNDPVDDKPMYKVTGEEDVNVFDGDSYLPQENMANLTLSEATDPAPGATPSATPPSQPPSQQAGIISPCAGALHTVDVTSENNPNFLDGGGSPFQGQDRPSCQTKLVTVRSGQATAPNFNLFTDVPIPTHFWGVTLNDLGLTFDKRSVNYGEAQGLPFVPVGLYDYAGRLVDTVHTDFNGLYEALEPSTGTYNCPVPAGPCPNMYRFVGNDPGQRGALNPDYNPRFRTIAASFQAWPGLFTVTDEAPTQVANVALAPDATTANPTQCDLGASYPQLFAVDTPVVRKRVQVTPTTTRLTTDAERTVTVTGINFGTTPGTVTLEGATGTAAPVVTSWTDTEIKVRVSGSTSSAAHALRIRTSAGTTGYNGITLQVVDGTGTSSATNPNVLEVGPGKQFATVQAALEAARPAGGNNRYWLVVVRPNAQTAANPRGEYTENLIVHHRVHLQGVGPGGFLPGGQWVPGSILDGLGFNPDNQAGADWLALLGSIGYSGDPQVPDAAVVTVLNPSGQGSQQEPSAGTYPVTIDGFTITGGVQLDFPANINTVNGGVSTPYGATGALVTQGGGIYVHDSVQNLQVSDNVIAGNGGSYGGGIRVGTPYVGSTGNNPAGSRNTGLTVARNQIRDNGGTGLAGGIGLFGGSDGYRVTENALCGNFSAEYGGAMTAFGWQGSQGGRIDHNRIWFNGSYDEGGGVMIAGELPSDPTQLSNGTGPVSIDHNTISANIANDDGGGIRLLQVSGRLMSTNNPSRVSVVDNTVVNNVSAHEGGGIALDDAPFVNLVHTTVARNLTTATAVTSDGLPAPAGLSSAANSDPLAARLRQVFGNTAPVVTTPWSRPTVHNDLFWDNRAGTYSGGRVTGIGVLPDGFDGGVENWDMGVGDVPAAAYTPVGSVLQTVRQVVVAGSDTVTDTPGLRNPFALSVDVLASRTYPAFRQAVVVAAVLPPNLMGDYHLSGTGSAGYRRGVWNAPQMGTTALLTPPADDVDGDPRPQTSTSTRGWDAGSDQLVP